MQKRAPDWVTYLRDPSQAVARHYGAQLTPSSLSSTPTELGWHGTIDDSPGMHRGHTQWLDGALEDLTGSGQLRVQTTQIQGCSVKWLEAH